MCKLFRVVVAASVFLLSSCSSSENLTASEDQVATFHLEFNLAEYRKLYLSTDQQLKESTPEKQFVELLEVIHRKLGDVKQTERQSFNVNFNTSGTFVTLEYATKFVEGSAQEQFVFLIKDKTPYLLNYNINSKDLILK